jgi:hypothetical protein
MRHTDEATSFFAKIADIHHWQLSRQIQRRSLYQQVTTLAKRLIEKINKIILQVSIPALLVGNGMMALMQICKQGKGDWDMLSKVAELVTRWLDAK